MKEKGKTYILAGLSVLVIGSVLYLTLKGKAKSKLEQK